MLPRMPFGENFTKANNDLESMRDGVAKIVTSLNRYEALGAVNLFSNKTKTIVVNGMKLVSVANTPVSVEVGDTKDFTLMIPFAGKSTTVVGREKYQWLPQLGAMFLPALGRGGDSSERASLMLDLDPLRLKSTALSMLDFPEREEIDLHLDRARLLELASPIGSFNRMIRNLCFLIDDFQCNPRPLAQMGIDDTFNRIVVMMLRPDLFVFEKNPTTASQACIERVCEYIQGNLASAISMSQLEKISGRSARALQYGFQERYQCTPIQWIREARLNKAYDLLSTAKEGDTVMAISGLCGFPNHGTFSGYYAKRFAETPSATLARALRRK